MLGPKMSKKLTIIKPKYKEVLSKGFPDVPGHIISHINDLMSIIDGANDLMFDQRLRTKKGTLDVLIELKTYYYLKKDHRIVAVNGEEDKNGLPQVYFDV